MPEGRSDTVGRRIARDERLTHDQVATQSAHDVVRPAPGLAYDRTLTAAVS
jgi:hypothetical protein